MLQVGLEPTTSTFLISDYKSGALDHCATGALRKVANFEPKNTKVNLHAKRENVGNLLPVLPFRFYVKSKTL